MLLYYPICIVAGVVIIRQHLMSGRRLCQAMAVGLGLFAFVVRAGLFQFVR